MTAFVAKMLTLLGVMLYAGGPIDAVTLIVQGENIPQNQDVLVEHIGPENQLSPSHAVVAGVDLFVDNEVQKSAVSFTEVGLRSGIGFEQ
ncbi:MAG: hypothetical protein P1U69_06015 [Parvibaculaceae bacterium]|nr:hypothetical protein [Parvibaculaceae bacterium]HBM88538.1 hypothetical protein [Rhodobiaceae bacterium]